MSHDRRHPLIQRGFTIVELLIVIVVIGILVAIVIVAYNGIQQRARDATVRADTEGSAKKMANDNTLMGYYAATAGAVDNNKGLPTSPGTSYVYHSTGSTYCITGTNGTSTYTISDTAPTPTVGGCPGDGVGGVAAITNLISNPSLNTGATGYSSAGHHTTAWVSGTNATGGSGYFNTIPQSTNGDGRAAFYSIPSSSLTANTTYTFSAYVRVAVGPVGSGVYIINLDTWGQVALISFINSTASVGSWARVSGTFTTPATQPTNGYAMSILTKGDNLNEVLDTSSWQLTQGSSLYNFTDGNSPNWIWNGTANNSTSTGPPQ